jgi:hypothetical protein
LIATSLIFLLFSKGSIAPASALIDAHSLLLQSGQSITSQASHMGNININNKNKKTSEYYC